MVKYVKVEEVQAATAGSSLSPVVFIHGAPDSPLTFAAYVTPEELAKGWLRGRGVYTVATPNQYTNPVGPPSLFELFKGIMYNEVSETLLRLMMASPTGKIVLVAHDFGATYCWAFVRSFPALANERIERMVSLSVGSSFRYDIFEHGPLALLWAYSIIFSLPYFFWWLPCVKYLSYAVWKGAGLVAPKAPTRIEAFPYWYAPLTLLRLPFDLLFGFLHTGFGFTGFTFPVLFMRSRMDSIASNTRFERLCRERDHSHIVLFPLSYTHWFVVTKADEVLAHCRPFIEHGKVGQHFEVLATDDENDNDALTQV